ncbi:hypothetical protein FALBO_12641 [Fusarium albosuccineum]|uniref:Uncharacterized protein n=1 Tax=Fusarium albosuccineum TaxID=1237068 RepID=A0A8H4L006_9HYPO|nr:hypothetical protein FALBO_12641 [Fusarium albosuccineum]
MKSAANSIPWDHGQRQKVERHAAITASGAEPGLKGQLSVVILRPQSSWGGGPLARSPTRSRIPRNHDHDSLAQIPRRGATERGAERLGGRGSRLICCIGLARRGAASNLARTAHPVVHILRPLACTTQEKS